MFPTLTLKFGDASLGLVVIPLGFLFFDVTIVGFVVAQALQLRDLGVENVADR